MGNLRPVHSLHRRFSSNGSLLSVLSGFSTILENARAGHRGVGLRSASRRAGPLHFLRGASRDLEERRKNRSEAFSIRRLGGSRWPLRRTRCATGFERECGSEQSLGRAATRGGNCVGMVAATAAREVILGERRNPLRSPSMLTDTTCSQQTLGRVCILYRCFDCAASLACLAFVCCIASGWRAHSTFFSFGAPYNSGWR